MTDYTTVDAVLFDFTGVVAHIRPSLVGESAGRYRISPVPEVIDAIARLRDGGLRTGLVSNNDRQALLAEATEIDFGALFDVMVFSSDTGYDKPDPRIYEYAASQLSLPVERCLFIDDLARNVDGALQAGMQGVVAESASVVVDTVNAVLTIP